MSVCPYVRPPSRNNSVPAGRIFMKIDISVFFENFQVSLKSDKNNGYLREDQYTFFIISCSILLIIRNQTKIMEKIRKYISSSIIFLFFENFAVYEIMWKNSVEPDTRQMTVWRMRIARWITKATNIHSEYVILIAFPLQQWLYERTSMLRYTYIACLVTTAIDPCSDLWKCMTCNLLKFKLQIISNKFFKRRMIYIAYCTEHSVSITNYVLENNVVVWPLFLITLILFPKHSTNSSFDCQNYTEIV